MRSLPGVLTQVMANLVINSLHHGFSGVRHPEIHIAVREEGERIVVEYRDNGVGVSKALHERIFEPFFTTRRGQGGSGLGLNIVYNLVTRKLLGRLDFQSAPGAGVSFVLDLPRRLPLEPGSPGASPIPGAPS
jgi:signal transduction histidine kinase